MSRVEAAAGAPQLLRRRRSTSQIGLWALALVVGFQGRSAVLTLFVPSQVSSTRTSCTVQRASVVDSLVNPVKTVSDSIADFYKIYPQPPVLPMYRAFIVDFLTQTHLTAVDARFKYNPIFGLGMWYYYTSLMGNYDKLISSAQSDKIWIALMTSLDMSPDQVKADAQAVIAYAGSTSPAEILKHMEGTASPADAKIAEAFKSIGSSLYSMSFSVGLFRTMQISGVETTKDNVEEWAKALKITPTSKVTSDLETYKQNQNRLQKAEEMIREIEIREKKKLAERLEQKAKALAEKAAAKTAEAKA